ncbi:hypothetical protein [Hyphomonas sp.]|jgi:hypothetical protein|uniref:hypothetical protein n=1 Tax=Hyphomonas sp. TaxID=87 RepID=UPI0037BF7BF1
MSTIYRMPKGQWRAQVRRKGRYVFQCFIRRKDAEEWALKVERRVDRGERVSKNIPDHLSTSAHLANLHIADMLEAGKALRRSKTYSPDKLKAKLGHVRLEVLDRERIIMNARQRARDGAGPATLAVDLAFIGTVLTPAAAVHGIPVNTEAARLARDARTNLESSEPEGAAGCVCEQGLAGTAGNLPVQAPGIPPPSGVTKS